MELKNEIREEVPYGEMVDIDDMKLRLDGYVTGDQIRDAVSELETHEMARLPITNSAAVQKKSGSFTNP